MKTTLHLKNGGCFELFLKVGVLELFLKIGWYNENTLYIKQNHTKVLYDYMRWALDTLYIHDSYGPITMCHVSLLTLSLNWSQPSIFISQQILILLGFILFRLSLKCPKLTSSSVSRSYPSWQSYPSIHVPQVVVLWSHI